MPPPTITIITGCSSGIGLATARLLSTEPNRIVVATVRKKEDISSLPSGVQSCILDVRCQAHCNALAARVARVAVAGGSVELVLNAGYGQPGFLGEDLPAEAIQQQFETNLVGQYRVLRTLWPILEASPHTRVVFISSVLGFVTLPGRVAYCASKAALESLADGLRLEMPEWRVVLIEPGPVEARFGENSLAALHHWVDVKNSRHLDKYLAAEKRIRNPSGDRVPSERVASLIKTALEESRPRSRYRICRTTHLAIWLKRLLPSQILDIAFRKAL